MEKLCLLLPPHILCIWFQILRVFILCILLLFWVLCLISPINIHIIRFCFWRLTLFVFWKGYIPHFLVFLHSLCWYLHTEVNSQFSQVFTDRPCTGGDSHQLIWSEIVGASQNFVLVQIAITVLSDPLPCKAVWSYQWCEMGETKSNPLSSL